MSQDDTAADTAGTDTAETAGKDTAETAGTDTGSKGIQTTTEDEPTFSQADLDRKISVRLSREQSKHKSELEKLQGELEESKAKASKAEKELKAMKADAERMRTVASIAGELGVDADVLGRMSASDEDEIRENAQLLKEKVVSVPLYPNVGDKGAQQNDAASADEIRKMKNPRDRVNAMAAHPELFK